MIDLEYIEIDGLLYPSIITGMENIENDLGKYGILRLRYLHEHKPAIYLELLLTGELAQHCADIDKSAFEMAESIHKQYLKNRSTPLDDSMDRIQIFTQIQMVVDEIVLHNLIYQ